MMWKLKLCIALMFSVAVTDVAGKCFNEVGIVGGDEVDIEQYPYQVSVILYGKHYCGGSIISEEYVLTAAHCIISVAANYKVRAGSSFWHHGGVLYNVESIATHSKFNGDYDDYDIAVIKISGQFKIDGKTTNIVKLPDADRKLNSGDRVTVTGWGNTGESPNSHVLKAATLHVMDKEYCREAWKRYGINVTPGVVCAGSRDESACFGDSGGPLVDKNMVQYGLVSFGDPTCKDPDIPNVYTNVAGLRGWIQEHTGV